MSSEEKFTPGPDPGASGVTPGLSIPRLSAGLPPVAPPSGKLMLQLFLVPGLIVAFLVVAWLVGGWLFGVSYSRDKFLANLKDPNAEVRWRAAEQLAQVLLRDESLASDGDFAWRLAVLLDETRESARADEQSFASRVGTLSKEDADKERAKLQPDRNFIAYLSACLGEFKVPVGAPVLKDMVLQKQGLEARALALQRRQTLWALANLGENLKRFDNLPGPSKDAVLDGLRVALWDAAGAGGSREDFLHLSADEKDAALERVEARPQSNHADWLRDALRALRSRARGVNDDMGVGHTLIACSRDDNPNLREFSAFAMNFWRGDAAVNARMEEALAALVQDDGHGEDALADPSAEENPNATEEASKVPGLQIRFNAAGALARLGSKQTRLDVVKDMLDENYLRGNFVLRPRGGGAERPNEAYVVQTLVAALKVVAELHKLRPDMDLSGLKPAVDALAGNAVPDVRMEAEKTQLALK